MSPKNILSHRNRTLLRELVITDFKLRYQSSVLGYMWSLVRPLFLSGILILVFGYALKIGAGIPHYPIYLLLGIVMWNFFVEATNNGLSSIVGRGDLIRKVNFPKYIIVVSGTISALINLAITMCVVFVFMAISHIGIRPAIAVFPLLIIELYVAALGMAFFLAALYVKYRDIGYVWELVLQVAFYATPIIYPLSLVAHKHSTLAKLMLLNPIAQIIQDGRYAMISPDTETLSKATHSLLATALPVVVIVVVMVAAAEYFRANSRYFAENV